MIGSASGFAIFYSVVLVKKVPIAWVLLYNSVPLVVFITSLTDYFKAASVTVVDCRIEGQDKYCSWHQEYPITSALDIGVFLELRSLVNTVPITR